MITSIINWFKRVVTTDAEKRRTRKRRDTTTITQAHYDFIVSEHRKWLEFNRGLPRSARMPISELCDHVNKELHMDKSHRALARIWGSGVKREDLPKSIPAFIAE